MYYAARYRLLSCRSYINENEGGKTDDIGNTSIAADDRFFILVLRFSLVNTRRTCKLTHEL